jgi:hypothetical protein
MAYFKVQSIPFTTQPKQVHPRVIDSPNLHPDTRVKVTLVARPLLTPVAQNCASSPRLCVNVWDKVLSNGRTEG